MIEVRALARHSELQEVVKLQKEIWGFEELELLPMRMFVVSTKVGGQAFGAFDGRKMVGFLVAIPGIKPGPKTYLHSHMLGVLPQYRDQRVGRSLKLAQREEAMTRNIDLIEWTFDPLELKNAFFNMERLGAIVRRFVPNQYGTTTSHLHGGLPTDRCTAEWWINGPRAQAIIAGQPYERGAVLGRIEVPNAIGVMRNDRFDEARDIQARIADQFQEAFRRDLAVIGFERSADSGAYLLGEWEGSGESKNVLQA